MIDIFALIVSHGLLVLVVLRVLKVRDPALPPQKVVVRRILSARPRVPPRA